MVIAVPPLVRDKGLFYRVDAPLVLWVVSEPEPIPSRPLRWDRKRYPVPAETDYRRPARFDRPACNADRERRNPTPDTITMQFVQRGGAVAWPDRMIVRPGGRGWRMEHWRAARENYAAANDWKLGARHG